MTVPTNTYTRFSVIGAREDLTDEIYNISPVETPVLTMLPRVTAKNTLH